MANLFGSPNCVQNELLLIPTNATTWGQVTVLSSLEDGVGLLTGQLVSLSLVCSSPLMTYHPLKSQSPCSGPQSPCGMSPYYVFARTLCSPQHSLSAAGVLPACGYQAPSRLRAFALAELSVWKILPPITLTSFMVWFWPWGLPCYPAHPHHQNSLPLTLLFSLGLLIPSDILCLWLLTPFPPEDRYFFSCSPPFF